MQPSTSLRLAVVVSHPTQYYSPWFRWLSANAGMELRVFYLWEFGVRAVRDPKFSATFSWDVDLLSGYEAEFVPNRSADPGSHRFRGFDNPELPSRLAAWRPDALLLIGYNWLSHLRAALWARRHNVPVVFRGDSHFLGRSAPGWVRMLPVRLLFRQFAAFAYVGVANRAYFRTLGVPERKLFFAPHCVDRTRFDPSIAAHHEAAAALRARLQLASAARVMLFAGKFVEWKQPRELLEAFLAARPANGALVFVGDGELRAALEETARGAPAGTVHFTGFANQSEMPARYALADVLALPSRGCYETWGLAVNEAMHMGRPCLVSDRVGCHQDLVTPGETGWVFRAADPADLKDKVARAFADDLAPLRNGVRERIAGYTFARAAQGLQAALASVRRGGTDNPR